MSSQLVMPIERLEMTKPHAYWVLDIPETLGCPIPISGTSFNLEIPEKQSFSVVPADQTFERSQDAHANAQRVGVISLSKFFPDALKIASSEFVTVLATFQASHDLYICGTHLQAGILLSFSIWQIRLEAKKFVAESIALIAKSEINLSKHLNSIKPANQHATRVECFAVDSSANRAHIGVRTGAGEFARLEFSWGLLTQYPYYTFSPSSVSVVSCSQVESQVRASTASSSLATVIFNSGSEIITRKVDKPNSGVDVTAVFKLNQGSKAVKEIENQETSSAQNESAIQNQLETSCPPSAIKPDNVLRVASDALDLENGPSLLVSLTELTVGKLVLRVFPTNSPSSCREFVLDVEPLGPHEHLLDLQVIAKENLAIRVVFELKSQMFRIEFFLLELDSKRNISLKLHTRLFRKNHFQISTNLVPSLISLLYLSTGSGDTSSLIISRQELKYPLIIHFDWDRETNQLDFQDQCYQLAPTNLPTTYANKLPYKTMPSAKAITDKISKVALTMQNKSVQVAAGISVTGSSAHLVLVGKNLYSLLQD